MEPIVSSCLQVKTRHEMAEILVKKVLSWDSIPQWVKIGIAIGTIATVGGTAINTIQAQRALPRRFDEMVKRVESIETRMRRDSVWMHSVSDSLQTFRIQWRCVIIADLEAKSTRPCLFMDRL